MTVTTLFIPLLIILSLVTYPLTRKIGNRVFYLLAAALTAAFATALSATQAVLTGAPLTDRAEWIPALGLNLSFRLDTISYIFTLIVTGVGALVMLYCRWYFPTNSKTLPRFAAVFTAFAASMYGLILADNMFLLVIFWEATSVFSFLLIGHATAGRTSRAAATQALLVTSLGGVALLTGFVLLAHTTGTASLTTALDMLHLAFARQPALTSAAIYLILAGALSKSAIFPFHFWLPGAMAAPTPVSAYLHAAAMVKAGIYLVSRLTLSAADIPGFHHTLILLGAFTMLLGGCRSLLQQDAKLVVAYGTVSQLGMLLLTLGVGTPAALFCGLALTVAHALAKAPLFLAVGIVDKLYGTRDMSRLHRPGQRYPALAFVVILASASMIGFPLFLGFVAKEAALTALLPTSATQWIGWLAFLVFVCGSVLTAAYTLRLVWGMLFGAGQQSAVRAGVSVRLLLFPPAVLALLTLFGGLWPTFLEHLQRRAVSVSAHGVSSTAEIAAAAKGSHAELPHLAVWHGFTPEFIISAAILLCGLLIAVVFVRGLVRFNGLPDRFTASHVYWVVLHAIDVFAVRLTTLTQRGSLPYYLAIILGTTVVSLGTAAFSDGMLLRDVLGKADFSFTPAQLVIAVLMIAATLFAVRAHTRFQAVVLVGVTGYGMAVLFALHGAPDLALTQILVETATLIAVVLVIRKLPQHIGLRAKRWHRAVRALIGVGVAAVIGVCALLSLGSRTASPISVFLPDLAYHGGHGTNVVNVTLVDIRGWDTLGEISVLLAAATGVASLIFVRTRVDNAPKLHRSEARARVQEVLRRVADPQDPVQRRTWLLAGRELDPSRRSILLEVVVRLIFHALIVLSFYLLLAGHNAPGGGFAGGLVAGLALVVRYLAGGRAELRATVPIDAGRILGSGLAIAALSAVLPVFFGQAALASAWLDLHLGSFGELSLVTSTVFDVGVYLVVVGLMLDVLRSLGAEIDAQEEREFAAAGGGR